MHLTSLWNIFVHDTGSSMAVSRVWQTMWCTVDSAWLVHKEFLWSLEINSINSGSLDDGTVVVPCATTVNDRHRLCRRRVITVTGRSPVCPAITVFFGPKNLQDVVQQHRKEVIHTFKTLKKKPLCFINSHYTALLISKILSLTEPTIKQYSVYLKTLQ